MKARSRPTGTNGKQPDQAPAQPGYWPKRLLTGHVHSHDSISASPASLVAYHQWIFRQIRHNRSNHNRSNQKGGYNDLPPFCQCPRWSIPIRPNDLASYLRQEPDEVIPQVRICAGAAG